MCVGVRVSVHAHVDVCVCALACTWCAGLGHESTFHREGGRPSRCPCDVWPPVSSSGRPSPTSATSLRGQSHGGDGATGDSGHRRGGGRRGGAELPTPRLRHSPGGPQARPAPAVAARVRRATLTPASAGPPARTVHGLWVLGPCGNSSGFPARLCVFQPRRRGVRVVISGSGDGAWRPSLRSARVCLRPSPSPSAPSPARPPARSAIKK